MKHDCGLEGIASVNISGNFHTPNQIVPTLVSLFLPRGTSRGVTPPTVAEFQFQAETRSPGGSRKTGLLIKQQLPTVPTIFSKDIQECKSLYSGNKTHSLASEKKLATISLIFLFLLLFFLFKRTLFNCASYRRVRKTALLE